MPLTLADPSAGDDLASRSIAIGTPSDFLDNFSAAWTASSYNDRFVGEQSAIADEYSTFVDDVFKRTGHRLPNPTLMPTIPQATPLGTIDDGSDFVSIQQFEAAARAAGLKPPSLAEMTDRAHALMRGAEATRNDTAARSPGFGASSGQFLGSMAAVTTDPPILATFAFGGGETAGFLRAVAREALTATATESAIQPSIQMNRIAAGLPGGFEQGAENVAMAAGGAAALTGVFRGAGAAYGALRRAAQDFKPSAAADLDAARAMERFADLQQHNPLTETHAGAAEHVDRVSAAQTRLYDPAADPVATALSDAPSNPVRPDVQPTARRAPIVPEDMPTAPAAVSLGQQLADAAKASEGGLDAFRRARATANEISPGLDDGSLDLARGAKPTPPADDPSLVQFIVRNGGINDSDRSLASLGISPRDRPGLISRSGRSASRMSELAAEAGYFPAAGPGEGGRAVDHRELASAIADELGGQKLYARHGAGGNSEARMNFEQATQLHGDLRSAFDELGLDIRRMSNSDIRDAVHSVANAPDPMPAQRHDFTAEAIDSAARASEELDYSSEFEERLAMAAENTLRDTFRDRMDEPIYFEVNGEVRAVSAREVFKSFDDDNRLVDEWSKCISEVPF